MKWERVQPCPEWEAVWAWSVKPNYSAWSGGDIELMKNPDTGLLTHCHFDTFQIETARKWYRAAIQKYSHKFVDVVSFSIVEMYEETCRRIEEYLVACCHEEAYVKNYVAVYPGQRFFRVFRP